MLNSNPQRERKTLSRRWIIRASAEDDQLARERAKNAGIRFSDYIRRMGVSGRVIVRHDASSGAALASLTAAINRAGNLVNQQMAIAHSRGELPASLLRLNEALAHAIDAVLRESGR